MLWTCVVGLADCRLRTCVFQLPILAIKILYTHHRELSGLHNSTTLLLTANHRESGWTSKLILLFPWVFKPLQQGSHSLFKSYDFCLGIPYLATGFCSCVNVERERVPLWN